MPFEAPAINWRKENAFKADLFGQETRMSSDNQAAPVLDLNNPPRVEYVHQSFPKMVYDHRKAKPAHDFLDKQNNQQHVMAELGQKVVHDADELEAALQAGYQLKPPTFAAPEAAEADEPYNPAAEVVAPQRRARK